ncbi:TetR/AcrR family transcriptional regulator [Streptococcus ovis]|uniref:TetR/AcrR family transcriptional regulator n=1 Tax=Streptococcus ovis TaxID=82806 RepID=UPI00035F449F|nr:TetR/AcrR family transcriptional regulator [Streptococcus ovis]
MKQDLRFEKTEKALQEAFLNLLQTKELSKISVKELCELAQVSRNAFYQHYETKEHLYDNILNELLLSIEDACRPLVKDVATITEVEGRLFLDKILLAVDQNRFVINQLLTSQPAVFTAAFHDMLVSANIQSSHSIGTTPNIAYIHIFSGGIVAFVKYWLLETKLTLEEAQDKLFSIVGQMRVDD